MSAQIVTPIADGGTGSGTAAGARTNLGLGTGDSPQFTNLSLTGNFTVGGNLTVGGAGVSTFTGAVTFASGVSSISTADEILSAIQAGAGARTIRVATTGGNAWFGIQNAAADFLFGVPANNTAIASPSNPIYLRATTVTTSANFTVTGNLTMGSTSAVKAFRAFSKLAHDFTSIAAQSVATTTVTVTGVVVGDTVDVAPPATLNDGLVYTGRVSAANTVTLTVANVTAAGIDPAALDYKGTVISH
ncbi:MAG: hypothetical protein V4773_04265 [Verrucomicrobiota bacterium]